MSATNSTSNSLVLLAPSLQNEAEDVMMFLMKGMRETCENEGMKIVACLLAVLLMLWNMSFAMWIIRVLFHHDV